MVPLKGRFIWPTWGPTVADRTQVGSKGWPNDLCFHFFADNVTYKGCCKIRVCIFLPGVCLWYSPKGYLYGPQEWWYTSFHVMIMSFARFIDMSRNHLHSKYACKIWRYWFVMWYAITLLTAPMPLLQPASLVSHITRTPSSTHTKAISLRMSLTGKMTSICYKIQARPFPTLSRRCIYIYVYIYIYIRLINKF